MTQAAASTAQQMSEPPAYSSVASACPEHASATLFRFFSPNGPVAAPAILGVGTTEDGLRDAMSHLLTMENAILPIMRLPPEILGHIFEMLQIALLTDGCKSHYDDPCHLRFMRAWPLDHPDQWMDVMLVCRCWRAIALSCASLWTDITIPRGDTEHLPSPTQLHFISRQLRNSQQHCLKVSLMNASFFTSRGDCETLLADILAQSSRFHELELTVGMKDTSGTQQLLPYVHGPVPSLEGLRLELSHSNEYYCAGSPSLLKLLFKDPLPALRSLAIDCFLPSFTYNFRGLRQLRLSSFCFSRDASRIMTLLELNPALEDLMLCNDEDRLLVTPGKPFADYRMGWCMRKLRKLALQNVHTQTIRGIMDMLKFPSDLFFYCSLEKWDIKWEQAPFPTGYEFAYELPHPRLTNNITEAQVFLTGTKKCTQVYTVVDSTVFCYNFTNPRRSYLVSKSAGVLLSRAQELWLDDYLDSFGAHLLAYVRNATKVYCAGSLYPVVQALSDVGRRPTIQSSSFPHLRELHVMNLNEIDKSWGYGVFAGPIPRARNSLTAFLEQLVEAQTQRRTKGCPLEAVYLYGSLKDAFLDESDLLSDGKGVDEVLETMILDTLREHVRVEFVRTGPMPRLRIPEHCRTQSGGDPTSPKALNNGLASAVELHHNFHYSCARQRERYLEKMTLANAVPGRELRLETSAHVHDVSSCMEHLLSTLAACCSSDGLGRIPANLDLQKMENHLQKMMNYVLTIKNATLPAMRLPPEILGRIFEMVQLPLPRDKPDRCDLQVMRSWPPDNLYQWMNLLLVCRRWHAVAVSHARLWTDIIVPSMRSWKNRVSSSRHLSRLLSNSQPCCLRVSFMNSILPTASGPHETVVSDILAHMSRIEELELPVGVDRLSETQNLFPCVPDPATSLKALHLNFSGRQTSELRGSIPEQWFGGSLPALRSLAISGVAPSFTYNFHKLKQLRLSGFDFPQVQTQLEALLKMNPKLEDLMLTNEIFSSSAPLAHFNTPSMKVSLPKLRKLAFDGVGIETARTILRALTLRTDLYLHFSKGAISPRWPIALPDGLQLLLTHPDFLQNITQVQLYLSFISCEMHAAGDLSAFTFSSITSHISPPFYAEHAKTVLCNARELWLDGSSDGQRIDELSSSCLRTAQNVTKLYCHMGLATVLRTLLEAARLPSSASSSLPLPRLLELHITNLELIEDMARAREGGDVLSGFTQPLAKILSARRAKGYPLEVLYLYGPLTCAIPVALQRGDDDDALETMVLEALQRVVRVEFVRTGSPPRMHVPEHCRTQGKGAWEWPAWDDRW
ncbi:hypothetical protein NM688_g6371 [Phlebia brevispora]|uniref:Uncharacterized protein n=1 Tax=Phlebia brevispora TaxID=194682 RepID=A0ACC1SGT9_9APHY|nr:hypothetical protein NM688_g6371 [Phlebia brevispora]